MTLNTTFYITTPGIDPNTVCQGGFTLIGDTDNHTELYVAYGEDEIPADNLYWDFEPEEDDTDAESSTVTFSLSS